MAVPLVHTEYSYKYIKSVFTFPKGLASTFAERKLVLTWCIGPRGGDSAPRRSKHEEGSFARAMSEKITAYGGLKGLCPWSLAPFMLRLN